MDTGRLVLCYVFICAVLPPIEDLDYDGTLCKFLIILPVSISIQYLKSFQTNDDLRDAN